MGTMTASVAPPIAAELRYAYFAWLDAPAREQSTRSIAALEKIRGEHGPVWAVYASAFYHGPDVRAWRQDLIAEIEAAL
jgi:hypothetical protein